MGFFDDVPEPELEIEVDEYRAPEWAAPPDNVVGASVGLDVPLVRTGDVAVTVTGLIAYPNGVSLTVDIRLRTPPDDARRDPWRSLHEPGRFRFGVQLPDGTKLSSAPGQMHKGDAPRLTPVAGEGDAMGYEMDLWLWPRAPAGIWRLACEWPEREIASVVELDATPIVDAAARAVVLWPDERPVDDEW